MRVLVAWWRLGVRVVGGRGWGACAQGRSVVRVRPCCLRAVPFGDEVQDILSSDGVGAGVTDKGIVACGKPGYVTHVASKGRWNPLGMYHDQKAATNYTKAVVKHDDYEDDNYTKALKVVYDNFAAVVA